MTTPTPILEGQRAHYASVKARLYGPRPVIRVPLPPALQPVPCGPRVRMARPRDYIFIKPRGAGANKSSQGGIWNTIAAETIIQEAAGKHSVTAGQIKGQCRFKAVVAARFEVYHRLSTELGYSLPMIGKTVGGRDHSGVLHGLRKHKAMLEAAGL